jgi:hypothetical protein
LKESFPELLCLTRHRDASVADLRSVGNALIYWDVNFIRLVHDWEVYYVSSFFNVLYSNRVGRVGEHRIRWTPSKSKSFEVKSFYKVLLLNDDSPFP